MTRPMPSQEELHRRYDYADGHLYYKVRVSRSCKAGDIVGHVNNCKRGGYRQTILCGVSYKVHRLIWKWHHGTEPEMIDHINGIRDDNRIENLRASDRRMNGANRRRDLPAYIYHHQGRYRVRLTTGDRRNVSVGMFGTVEEAKNARDIALEEYGERSPD